MDRSVQSWGELVDAADRGLNGSGAVVEASRRLTAGLAAFEASSRSSSQTLLEAQTRLLIAINASSDCAATQTDR